MARSLHDVRSSDVRRRAPILVLQRGSLSQRRRQSVQSMSTMDVKINSRSSRYSGQDHGHGLAKNDFQAANFALDFPTLSSGN